MSRILLIIFVLSVSILHTFNCYAEVSVSGEFGSTSVVELPMYIKKSNNGIDIVPNGNGIPKTPFAPRMIKVGYSSLFLGGLFMAATLYLYKDEELIYMVDIPANMDEVKVPFDFINGNYRILISVSEESKIYEGSLTIST